MVAGIKIPAFDHVRQYGDQVFLHACNRVVLILRFLDVMDRFVRHLVYSGVEVFYLVASVDVEAANLVCAYSRLPYVGGERAAYTV